MTLSQAEEQFETAHLVAKAASCELDVAARGRYLDPDRFAAAQQAAGPAFDALIAAARKLITARAATPSTDTLLRPT